VTASTSTSTSSTDVAALTVLEVGRILRPHGLRGEVVVDLVTHRVERLAPGSVLATDKGPLTVEASRPHQERHLVTFAGVRDRTGAEALAGLVLRAEPVEDPDVLWVHDLVGSEVVEAGGVARGRVTAVVANPAADLLELESGALVPLVFVTATEPGRITIDPPDGLFE
jgi:16S rRNA processing protein RimM